MTIYKTKVSKRKHRSKFQELDPGIKFLRPPRITQMGVYPASSHSSRQASPVSKRLQFFYLKILAYNILVSE